VVCAAMSSGRTACRPCRKICGGQATCRASPQTQPAATSGAAGTRGGRWPAHACRPRSQSVAASN
jgi:hypothetical protein